MGRVCHQIPISSIGSAECRVKVHCWTSRNILQETMEALHPPKKIFLWCGRPPKRPPPGEFAALIAASLGTSWLSTELEVTLTATCPARRAGEPQMAGFSLDAPGPGPEGRPRGWVSCTIYSTCFIETSSSWASKQAKLCHSKWSIHVNTPTYDSHLSSKTNPVSSHKSQCMYGDIQRVPLNITLSKE